MFNTQEAVRLIKLIAKFSKLYFAVERHNIQRFNVKHFLSDRIRGMFNKICAKGERGCHPGKYFELFSHILLYFIGYLSPSVSKLYGPSVTPANLLGSFLYCWKFYWLTLISENGLVVSAVHIYRILY